MHSASSPHAIPSTATVFHPTQADGTAVLVAGCGVNRWTNRLGANVFDFSVAPSWSG
ncbi:MAG: hypothetical protein ABIF77_08835 [bacterium]